MKKIAPLMPQVAFSLKSFLASAVFLMSAQAAMAGEPTFSIKTSGAESQELNRPKGYHAPATNGGVTMNATPSAAVAAMGSTSEKRIVVEIPDLSLTTELTQEEMAIIDLKKDMIVKYLYEQKELDGLRELLKKDSRSKEYRKQLEDEVPLSATEILNLRQQLRDAESAKNRPLEGSRSLDIRTISLDINAPDPITLNVSPDYASSIVFFDQTGKPWPIEEEAIGSSQAFSAQTLSKAKHIVVFENIKAFSESNALINLVGLPMPIVIKLKGSDSSVDSRLSVRIPKLGPNAQAESFVRNEVDTVDDLLLNFLNGTIPDGAIRYQLDGTPGEIYYFNKQLYLRTEASLHSPPPKSVAYAPTGHKAYILSPVTNLLMSFEGKLIEAQVSKTSDAVIPTKKSIFD